MTRRVWGVWTTLGRIGEFDASAAALDSRARANERGAAHDLNAWIFGVLKPAPGERCLDLGSGLGKQALPLARAVGLSGGVTAVDVSGEALARLGDAAAALEGAGRIDCVEAAFDALPARFAMAPFDIIHVAYSLYYAEDPAALFERLFALAAPGARFFFCGPGGGNNGELLDLAAAAGVARALGPRPVVDFMEDIAPAICRRLAGAGRVTLHRLENPVAFETAEALAAFWSNHNLYDAAAAPRFRALAEDRFRAGGRFVNTKRIVGVYVETGDRR